MVDGLIAFKGPEGRKRLKKVREELKEKGFKTPESRKRKKKKAKKKTEKKKGGIFGNGEFIKGELGIKGDIIKRPEPKKRSLTAGFLKLKGL